MVRNLGLFYNRGLSEFAISHFVEQLKAEDVRDLRHGFNECLKREARFPTLEKFQEYVQTARARREAAEKPRPSEIVHTAPPKEFTKMVSEFLHFRGTPEAKTRFMLSRVQELQKNRTLPTECLNSLASWEAELVDQLKAYVPKPLQEAAQSLLQDAIHSLEEQNE